MAKQRVRSCFSMTPAVPGVKNLGCVFCPGKFFRPRICSAWLRFSMNKLCRVKMPGIALRSSIRCSLQTGTGLQSESLELFDDDSLNSMERPVRVEMIFLNLPLNRSLSLSLEHGPDDLNNWTSVTYYEDARFNDLTTKFADAMSKVPSQKGSWLRKQKRLSQLLKDAREPAKFPAQGCSPTVKISGGCHIRIHERMPNFRVRVIQGQPGMNVEDQVNTSRLHRI